MDRIRFTQAGFDELTKELEELRAARPAVILDVSKARELGDLKENGYYQASKAKLRSIDSRITHVNYYLKTGLIIADTKGKGVTIGSKVIINNGKKDMTYHFVGDLEANPSEGKLSLLSPLGRAIEGKEEGQSFDLELPAGKVTYKIVKVS